MNREDTDFGERFALPLRTLIQLRCWGVEALEVYTNLAEGYRRPIYWDECSQEEFEYPGVITTQVMLPRSSFQKVLCAA